MSSLSSRAGAGGPEKPLTSSKMKALDGIAKMKQLKDAGVDAVDVFIDNPAKKLQMLKTMMEWLDVAENIVANLYDRSFYERLIAKGKPYYARDVLIDKDIISALVPTPTEIKWTADGAIDMSDINRIRRAFGTEETAAWLNQSVFDFDNCSLSGNIFFAEALNRALADDGLIAGAGIVFFLFDDDTGAIEQLTKKNMLKLAEPGMYILTPMTGPEHNCVKLIGVNDKANLVVATYAAARGKTSQAVPMVKAHALFTGGLVMASLKLRRSVKSTTDDFSHLPHEMVQIKGVRYTVALTHIEPKGDNSAREAACAKKQREAAKAGVELPGCKCHRAVKCMWLKHTTYYG